jgi:hypothetical protein
VGDIIKMKGNSPFRLLVSLVVLVIGGCSTVSVQPPPGSSTEQKQHKERSNNYEIGREQVASIGEAVIRVKEFEVFETRTIDSDRVAPDRSFDGVCEFPGPDLRFRGTKDQPFPIAGTTQANNATYRIIVVARNLSGEPIGVALNADSGVAAGPCAHRTLLGWRLVGTAKFLSAGGPPIFSTPTRITRIVGQMAGPDNFELVYLGITRQSMSLLYREYTDQDFARPAFSQTLNYDLSDSDVIAFRKLRIRVIKAGNQDIRYVVTAN